MKSDNLNRWLDKMEQAKPVEVKQDMVTVAYQWLKDDGTPWANVSSVVSLVVVCSNSNGLIKK